ncbi:SEC-C motif-containing protein [Seinonella peptonophila]|uniref:SEC-C motif-containing protein n=1 Tax=Seinonella peptonophila TaxID=112248 RepID=A0A1M4V2J1_9BACL|nr:SEC-C domain-containing protein [Seinonella peptonophila]SHE63214.1 SEC-C motif-containing protein [Seinonella peptonophila]
MAGRNDPCPCGSHKKYKKCCERVIAFSQAEQVKARREREWFMQGKSELVHWFKKHWSDEKHCKWSSHFKELLQLEQDQPIPQHFYVSFAYWLLFDACCMEGERPVDRWIRSFPVPTEQERLIHSFKDLSLSCYEVIDIREERMLFHRLFDGVKIEIHTCQHSTFEKGDLVFTRLIRFGNHYQFVGPYTSFVHEMRGEILVQLEKFNHPDEEHKDYTTRNHVWRVLGYSIQRAKELERIEELVAASEDVLGSVDDSVILDAMEQKEANQKPGLPLKIMQQLEQFFVTCVSPLQKKTQSLYGDSFELLFRFLSDRYGQSFDWKQLDRDTLIHFFTVWYLDHVSTTPTSSKIFLNTMKTFFRWLAAEKISDIYHQFFQPVYLALIRTLPITIEARKWLRINGVTSTQRGQGPPVLTDLYQLAISSSGPVLLVGNKWISVRLSGFPPMWEENRFWIRGSIQKVNAESVFTHIENVYPAVMVEESNSPQPLRYIENSN